MCLVGAACGRAADDREPGYEENGVRIVASERPAWGDGEGWRISREPTLVIGEATDDPRYLFSTIFEGRRGDGRFGNSHGVGPYKLPDGSIAVGDKQTVTVRFYDENGQFVRAALQQGGGPAELPALGELHHCEPGTLAAIGAGRLGVIDGQGDVRGSHLFVENIGRRLIAPLACSRDGRLLAMDRGQAPSADGGAPADYARSIAHILLLDIDGSIDRDFGEFPGVDRYPSGRMPRPLGKYTALALTNERAFIGTADQFEIQVWSLDGVLQERWSRPTGDLGFDEDDLDPLLDEEPTDHQQWMAIELLRIGLRETEDQVAGRAAIREALPDTLPAYSRFVVDATGHLWVEHYRYLTRHPHLWSVFAPDGSWLGEVEVPGTFDITDIGRDYVLGVYRNELDEQSVRSYRLPRD